MNNTYTEPVSQLLTFGEAEFGHKKWGDYSKLGLNREHIPELIRMSLNRDLHDSDDYLSTWAPIHAWRVLGQMGAEEAIEPLLILLYMDDDYACEDVASVYAKIGPAAIPAITNYMLNASGEDYSSGITRAVESLMQIGQANPEHIPEIQRVMIERLAHYKSQDEMINSFIIETLSELKAVEALPLIREVFEADCISGFGYGDMEDVQVEMGLIPERITPRIITEKQRIFRESLRASMEESRYENEPEQAPVKKKVDKNKKEANKKKMAKLSKKKNRKR